MDETIGFVMNLDTAMEFWTRCKERKANTREERIKVLEELKSELRTLSLTKKDLKRHVKGKKILHIKGNPND